MTPNPNEMASESTEIKSCCANLYESDWAKLLLGDSFHPGGLRLTERLGRLLSLGHHSSVLDVASGRGTTAIYLADTFGCQVIGVDYSKQNVAEATTQAEAKKLGTRIHFLNGDAEALPLPDASVDAVICECSFCTFPNKSAAVKELFRVLARGGQVGISDLTRQGKLPVELNGVLSWLACIGDAKSSEEYAALLTSAGFSVNSAETHPDALNEMVEQIRMKLLGAELLVGLDKLSLPGVDFGSAKHIAHAATAAIHDGKLGYVLLTATKN